MRPDPPTLLQGMTPAFTAPEVYDDLDRYIKLYQKIFGVKQKRATARRRASQDRI